MEAAFAVLEESVDQTRRLLMKAIPAIPETPSCGCGEALPGGPFAEGPA
jgi:hypothetical protein